MDTENSRPGSSRLDRYVTPLAAWALAFGCAVGWGAFMMPGSTFLPQAGPLGTVLGIVIGGIIMVIIGFNYHYMINLYPDAGGAFAYAKKEFGYDHGFLCAWFLILTYVAIIWANATALPLLFRNLLGGVFQFTILLRASISGSEKFCWRSRRSRLLRWSASGIGSRDGYRR